MVVEFKTVRQNAQEVFEREQTIELHGIHSIEFGNQKDYITSIFVEMDDVIDFTGGRAYHNQEFKECVYLRLNDDQHTPNILMSIEEFKKIFEETRNCKIKTAEEILNNKHNENYPTGI